METLLAQLIPIGFCLVALYLLLQVVALPVAVLRATGVVKAGRWLARTAWRSVVGTMRVLACGRRPSIRRPAGQSPTQRAGWGRQRTVRNDRPS